MGGRRDERAFLGIDAFAALLLTINRLSDNVGGAKRFSIFCAAVVRIFFTAGLLYLLCFDNLGAYSPSETGLHPI